MIATVIELAELLRIQIKIQVVQCVVGDASEQRIEIHTVARRELVQQEHAASVAMVIMDSISFRRFRRGKLRLAGTQGPALPRSKWFFIMGRL
jgi:hypothetical protein